MKKKVLSNRLNVLCQSEKVQKTVILNGDFFLSSKQHNLQFYLPTNLFLEMN